MRGDYAILILFLESSEFISVLLLSFYFLHTAAISKNFLAVVFCGFKDNDVMVLEAGIRKRRDTHSQNILVIASIGINHTNYIDEAETEVADEKIAAASENSKLILVPKLSDVYSKIVDYTEKNNLKFKYINGNYDKSSQT